MNKKIKMKGLAFGLVAVLLSVTLSNAQEQDKQVTPALQPQTINDYTTYFSKSWTGYIAPFNKGSLEFGKDYTESNTVMPGTFPDGSKLRWRWSSNPSTSIYDFNSIQFGNYANTHPPSPIPSKPLGDIHTLKLSHQSSVAGTLDGFDTIIDIFLTQQPGGDLPHLYEIEVFLHTSPYCVAFANNGQPIGTVNIDGITWTVTIEGGSDILFMPFNKADVMSEDIDLKSMFHYLIGRGVISKSLYFNGLAYGTETQFGSGSMTINHLDVTYN